MKLKKKNLQIAIDGPVGAGKSVGAHLLAQKLGIVYFYSGAMYRATAWLGIKNGLDLENEEELVELLKKNRLELVKSSKKNRVCDVLINGQNITDELFSSQIHDGSSRVAVLSGVRKYLVNLQKQAAKDKAVVMEGRDITTVVLPQADLKIYMTADLQTRAKRRLKDLLARGEKVSLEEVVKEIEKRDYRDSHRKMSPLKKADDAWVLDTTNLSIEGEIDKVIDELKKRGLVE